MRIEVDYSMKEYERKYTPPKEVKAALSHLLRRCGVIEGTFTAAISPYDRMAQTKRLLIEGVRSQIWIRYRPFTGLTSKVLAFQLRGEGNLPMKEIRRRLRKFSEMLNQQAKQQRYQSLS